MKTFPVVFAVLTAASMASQPALADRTIVVCTPDDASKDCGYTGLAEAALAARDGDTLIVRPGIYREAAVLRASRLSLLAEPGAHMMGVAAHGKAALVIKGDDILIQGLECSQITVPDGNGACVRAEGRNLTLRSVYFHHSQEGLLGGLGRVLIEDSRFEHLGGDTAAGAGQAHAIYVGHKVDEFILRRSRILSSKEEGHEVKSRARTTIIEDNVIASLDGVDSRQIDIPNAGVIVIRRNVIQKGRHSSNPAFIGIGLERRAANTYDKDHYTGPALIKDNLFIVDYGGSTQLSEIRNTEPAMFVNNTVIGDKPQDLGQSEWFRTRKSGGVPPYPYLPQAPPS